MHQEIDEILKENIFSVKRQRKMVGTHLHKKERYEFIRVITEWKLKRKLKIR